MTSLPALLERVKAASGPDRELDLALAAALAPDVLVMRQRDDDSGSDPYTYWEYTGSIDAALGLVVKVMPGWIWGVSIEPDGRYGCVLGPRVCVSSDPRIQDVRAPTAPLAILAALLLSAQIERGAG